MAKFEDISDPDFSKFRKIPPAFAGILVDWSIGSREITATTIDLIVRDYLSVIGEKIILNNKKSGLLNFEKEFIKTIFQDRKDMEFKEFSDIAYKDKFKYLLKIISEGIIAEGFIKENYNQIFDEFCDSIVLDDSQKDNYFAKYKNFFDLKHPVSMIFKAMIFFIIFTIVGLIYDIIESNTILEHIGGRLIVLGTMFAITTYGVLAYHHEFKKRYIKFDKLMLTDKGLALKSESMRLMKYMKSYPMYEDRISNELA
jgi:hypothetical protein